VERELVEQAQRGDQEAFAALVELTADRLYGIAYRILRDPALADDALQNALIAIWQRLPELRDADRFEAWTYRMIVRASYREAERTRSLQVRAKRFSILSPREQDGPLDRIATRDELEQAFRGLTAEHRAVLVLRHFIGLPIAAIAETLEIPVGTAASRLHYATRNLRAAFEADTRGVVAWRHPA